MPETVIPFDAEVKTESGKIVTRKTRLRVISVQRQDEAPNNEVPKTSNLKPLEGKVATYQNILTPPYDMLALVELEETSNILRECIDAMVTNIEGYGQMFRPRKISEEIAAENEKQIEAEKAILDGWLDVICPELSFTETRKRMRRDLELTGNGYWEIVRGAAGRVIEINHVPSHSIRLTKLDEETTVYATPVIRPELGYTIQTVERRKRFRRFVQLVDTQPSVYFKEYGDPRTIDKKTGEVWKGPEPLALSEQATEVVHFKVYSPRSVYGIPRFIGRFVSILGSRRAEEINFFTLSNNYVPSMFIMVENGSLTDGTISRLTELIESQASSDPNYSKIIIIEGEAAENESFAGQIAGAKIHIHEPKSAQKTDEMFKSYDTSNQDKVRQSFRLPPLLVGRAEDYTRATAKESLRVGDEQVFNPERESVNSVMNRIMLDQGFRWYVFRTRTPNITDNEVLAKAMAVAEKSGGMTPRRADVLMQDIFEGELGPMPQGLDLDVPFTLQFAFAQNGMKTGTASVPASVTPVVTEPGEPDEQGEEGIEMGEGWTVEDRDWAEAYIRAILRSKA